MRILKKSLLFILIAVIIFVAYLIINTLNFDSKQITVEPITPLKGSPEAINHFAEALKIKTVSPENTADFDSIQFKTFNSFLEKTYPLADSLLEKKIFI